MSKGDGKVGVLFMNKKTFESYVKLNKKKEETCECIKTWNGVVDIECDACAGKDVKDGKERK